jgi:hypothetical protein
MTILAASARKVRNSADALFCRANKKYEAELAYWRKELLRLRQWFEGSRDWWGIKVASDRTVYPKPANGRPPVGIERMLRLYFFAAMVQPIRPGRGRGAVRFAGNAAFRGDRPRPRASSGRDDGVPLPPLVEAHDLARELFDARPMSPTAGCCPICCTAGKPVSGATKRIAASGRRSGRGRPRRATSPTGVIATAASSTRASGRRTAPNRRCAP